MKKINLLAIGTIAFALQNVSAQAQIVESWENTLDGWTVQSGLVGGANPSGPVYTSSFSTTTGVTDGSFSLALTGSAGPNFGQMLQSSFSPTFTALLANASSLSFDIFTPPGSFGFFLQFDVDINNNDTGFVSLDGFNYISTVIGSETTITVPVSSSLRSTLAASVNPTQIIFQVGGGSTAGNDVMYFDNLRVTPVPEPSTMALAGLGALGLLKFARRRNS